MPRSITLTLILSLLTATPHISYAWDVVDSHSIPAGANALCPGFEELWCGYKAQEDSVILVIDPDDGHVIAEHTAPEIACRGIGFRDDSFWFLGMEDLYHLNENGELIGISNIPYERMKGLVGTPDGFLTLVLLGDGYYVAEFTPDGNEISRFRIGIRQPCDLAFDGENVWVTDPIEGFIHRIDMASGRVMEILRAPDSYPCGITYHDNYIYVTTAGDDDNHDRLYKMDTTPEPNPRLLPSSRYHDFGFIVNGTTLRWGLTLFNVGSDTLRIGTVRLANGANSFRQLDNINGVTILPNEFITPIFIFEPRAFGVYRDTVLIQSTDPVEPMVTVEIIGTGLVGHRSLNIQPDPVEFGVVRADPWRDGVSLNRVHLINQGWDDLRIEQISNDIEEIFYFDAPQLPYVVFPAETLTLDMWFEPHNGIGYADTLLVVSNDPLARIYLVSIHGRGDATEYIEGSVLWQHVLDEGDSLYGSATPGPDVNGDGFSEVIAISANGSVDCLNGFGSNDVDVLWSQNWDTQVLRPTLVHQSDCFSAASDLNGDGTFDILAGSGGDDRAVYGINGMNGDLIWRWDSRSIDAGGAVEKILAEFDIGGDGSVDPVVFLPDSARQDGKLTRLDGGTGRPIWVRSISGGKLIAYGPDLNRDGVSEVFVSGLLGDVFVYDGLNGGLMQQIELMPLAQMITVNDINHDGFNDMILAPDNGGLLAYSVFDEEVLWEFDREDPGAGFGVISVLKTEFETSDSAETILLAAGTERGFVMMFDDLTGEDPLWTNINHSSATTLDFHQDMDADERKEVLAGFEDGHIKCVGSAEGVQLWGFTGDFQQVGPIGRLFSFEDIDLGFTDDIVALAGDGIVRCISSGGDLEAGNSVSGTIPTNYNFSLFPNPFNSTASLQFKLPEKDQVRLIIVDATGRVVLKRDLGILNSGLNNLTLDYFEQNSTSGGIYFFQLTGKQKYAAGSGILLK